MRIGGVGKGRAVAYHGLAYYYRGARKVALSALYRAFQRKQIVRVVHAYHLPALRGKPCGNIFAEGAVYLAFDGNIVSVV